SQRRNPQNRPIEDGLLSGLADPQNDRGDDGDDERRDPKKVRAEASRNRDEEARGEWELRCTKAFIVLGERGHHEPDDDEDENERETDENGGIDQRREGLSLDRRDDLCVVDVPPQHTVETPAALARQERGRVDAWEQIAMRCERVG